MDEKNNFGWFFPQIDWQRENVTIETSERFTIETNQDVHMYTTTLTVHKTFFCKIGFCPKFEDFLID